MFEDAIQYEKSFKATGSGAFGEIEFDGKESMVLRVAKIKSSEVSGVVRLYFDNARTEVISGRRFEPMVSMLLRPGVVYKVHTTLRLVNPKFDGEMQVSLTDDASGVMYLPNSKVFVDEDGTISFLVIPFRRIDISDQCVSFARLKFLPVGRAIKGTVMSTIKTASDEVLGMEKAIPSTDPTKKATSPNKKATTNGNKK